MTLGKLCNLSEIHSFNQYQFLSLSHPCPPPNSMGIIIPGLQTFFWEAERMDVKCLGHWYQLNSSCHYNHCKNSELFNFTVIGSYLR